MTTKTQSGKISASASGYVKQSKQLAKLREQTEEIRLYEEKIHHFADLMIKIDLPGPSSRRG